MNFKLDKSITITIIVVVALLFAVNLILNSVGPQENTVTVEGISSIKVVPDVTAVYLNIEKKADTADVAKDEMNAVYNKLVEALKEIGIAETKIQTTSINVYPNNEWINDKMVQKGYIATQSIRLELGADDSVLLGKVIDASVNSGTNVGYLNFELSQAKQNEFKAQALTLAASDAKIKAESLAQGFDKSLGRLVSTSTSDFNYYPWRMYSSSGASDSAMMKAEVANINPSEQDVSARVTATYKLR